jgi:hypothetical protein
VEAQQAAWNNPAAQNFKLNGKCIRHSDPIRTFERSTTLAQRGTNSFQFRFFWILVIIPIRSPLRYSNLTHSHHSPAVQFRVMHKTYTKLSYK